MKKVLITMIAILAITSCAKVEPGYVALRVWTLGKKAGEIDTLGVGRYSLGVQKEYHKFPVFKQNYVWTKDMAEGSPVDESITFPIEGLTINIDVGIEFSIDSENVAKIYSEYRKTLEGITDGPLRNYVRDSTLDVAKNYHNMEQFISKNEISDMMDKVEVSVQSYFTPKGILVEKIYLVGAPRYPQSVISSIEEKIKATQRAIQRENELREAEAEAKKKVAQAEGDAQAQVARARAEAEANALRQKSYTEEVLRAMWIERWDGKLPQTVTGDELSILMGM